MVFSWFPSCPSPEDEGPLGAVPHAELYCASTEFGCASPVGLFGAGTVLPQGLCTFCLCPWWGCPQPVRLISLLSVQTHACRCPFQSLSLLKLPPPTLKMPPFTLDFSNLIFFLQLPHLCDHLFLAQGTSLTCLRTSL